MTVTGNFCLSNGTFDLTASGNSILNVAGNLGQTGGTLTETDSSSPSANLNFDGNRHPNLHFRRDGVRQD